MFFSATLLTLAGIARFVAAQSNGTAYPYMVAPGEFNQVDKNNDCLAQRNSCRQICGGIAPTNNCDAGSLQWTCTCSDGSSPNITHYQQTIPYFMCLQYRADCVRNTNDATAQQACNMIPCATQLPQNAAVVAGGSGSGSSMAASASSMAASASSVAASASSMAASTASPTAVVTSTLAAAGSSGAATAVAATTVAASAASAAASKAAGAHVGMAKNYATGVFAAVVFAILGLAL